MLWLVLKRIWRWLWDRHESPVCVTIDGPNQMEFEGLKLTTRDYVSARVFGRIRQELEFVSNSIEEQFPSAPGNGYA